MPCKVFVFFDFLQLKEKLIPNEHVILKIFAETQLEKLYNLGMYGVSHKQVHMLLFMGLKPPAACGILISRYPRPKLFSHAGNSKIV